MKSERKQRGNQNDVAQIVDDEKLDSNSLLEETDIAKKKAPFLEKSQSIAIEPCETETVDETEPCVAQENSIRGSDASEILGSSTVKDSSNRCSTTPPNNPPHSHMQTKNGGPTSLIEPHTEHGIGHKISEGNTQTTAKQPPETTAMHRGCQQPTDTLTTPKPLISRDPTLHRTETEAQTRRDRGSLTEIDGETQRGTKKRGGGY
ncbi:cell division cycle protein 27B-like [Dorcoceras hygrometricum]|uniref:Cell division cycle protein 27B-like n=1 Tax=Dorcoceras hygrometricum TaxID=472368 RepID=A0A2Z7AT33_9LAMI|nr:cell division cycle protein 27B-like [Dorcoceras hygrometricum]